METKTEKATTASFALTKQMKTFLIRLVLLVVCWQALYIFVLKPIRVPDAFLTHVLTTVVTGTLNTVSGLSPKATYFVDNYHAADHIQQNGKTILTIFDDCNGLDLYVIYLGLVFLLPFQMKRKLKFAAIGIVAIFIGNIIRCFGLYWVYVNYRSAFDFNHHYVFTIMMYMIILFCWLFYTKKGKINEVG